VHTHVFSILHATTPTTGKAFGKRLSTERRFRIKSNLSNVSSFQSSTLHRVCGRSDLSAARQLLWIWECLHGGRQTS
jgi:hypothetical protein